MSSARFGGDARPVDAADRPPQLLVAFPFDDVVPVVDDPRPPVDSSLAPLTTTAAPSTAADRQRFLQMLASYDDDEEEVTIDSAKQHVTAGLPPPHATRAGDGFGQRYLEAVAGYQQGRPIRAGGVTKQYVPHTTGGFSNHATVKHAVDALSVGDIVVVTTRLPSAAVAAAPSPVGSSAATSLRRLVLVSDDGAGGMGATGPTVGVVPLNAVGSIQRCDVLDVALLLANGTMLKCARKDVRPAGFYEKRVFDDARSAKRPRDGNDPTATPAAGTPIFVAKYVKVLVASPPTPGDPGGAFVPFEGVVEKRMPDGRSVLLASGAVVAIHRLEQAAPKAGDKVFIHGRANARRGAITRVVRVDEAASSRGEVFTEAAPDEGIALDDVAVWAA